MKNQFCYEGNTDGPLVMALSDGPEEVLRNVLRNEGKVIIGQDIPWLTRATISDETVYLGWWHDEEETEPALVIKGLKRVALNKVCIIGLFVEIEMLDKKFDFWNGWNIPEYLN